MSRFWQRWTAGIAGFSWCVSLSAASLLASDSIGLERGRGPDEPPAPPWHETAPQGESFKAYPRTAARTLSPAADSEPLEAEIFQHESKPASNSAALNPELASLQAKIRQALELYYPKKLNTRDHNSWEIMHAIIAYGVKTEVLQGGPTGEPVSAIGWLGYNGQCRGGGLMMIENGRVAARQGVNVQGHHGQFLAILAQSRLRSDYPLRVEGQDFTIQDLIETEKLGCLAGTELTFKLIALMHYLPSDAEWKNRYGETWNFARLIDEEIRAPIRGAPCGGTHRLMGLSYAVQKRLQREEPLDGEFARAKQYLDEYHRYTFALQNPDGSFSTEWFKGRGNRPDTDRKLQTTGHILEWLSFSLPHEQLSDPRTMQAANFIADILLNEPERAWEIGPLGHALHALSIYNYRMFQYPPTATQVAKDEAQDAAMPAVKAPKTDESAKPSAVKTAPLPPVASQARSSGPSSLPQPEEAAEPPLPAGTPIPLVVKPEQAAVQPSIPYSPDSPPPTVQYFSSPRVMPTPEPDNSNRGRLRPFARRR